MIVTPANGTTISDSTGAIVLLVFEVLLVLWIIIVNFLLWIELRITIAFHIPLNYILANLILSNYVFAVTSLPFEAINLGLVWHWKFGIGLCELWHGFDVVSRTAFPWFLVVLSVERWLFCFHHHWYNTRKLYEAIIGFVCTWVFVILLAFLGFMIIGRPNFSQHLYTNYYTCFWSDRLQPYIIYHAITTYFLPILLALLLYLLLICCLAKRATQQVGPDDKKPVSRGVHSVWSDMSLPPTPSQSRRPSTSRDNIPMDEMRSSPTRRQADDEDERPSSRFSWTEIIFNNILLQKALKTPAEKPTLNEDLIKTLPANRHHHPHQDPDYAEKLKSPQRVRHSKHEYSQRKQLLKEEDKEDEQQKKKKARKARQSDGSTPPCDSGFGSRTQLAQQQRRWTTHNKHGGDPEEIPEEDEDDYDDEDWDVNTAIQLNSIKWLWVVYVIYIICWLPFYAMYIHAGFCSSCTVSWLTYSGLRWFGALNSAINPLVLILIVREYRKALSWLISCKDPNRLYVDDDFDDNDSDRRTHNNSDNVSIDN